ncbi:MAG: sensor histidine kinase [Clostridia bacterium]|nr:sensor histidine kinase [Clostridia bacterium]
MKELSLNILDIAMNSVKAGAKNVSLILNESENEFSFSVTDDGCGMTEEFLKRVTDPFCTTRTTRKVGMGIPFLKLIAEQTGGHISITSRAESEYPDSHGTTTTAYFNKNHIDCLPLGDIVSTVFTLIQGSPNIDFEFKHIFEGRGEVSLSTKALREVLGDVGLDCPEVALWIKEYLEEQYSEVKKYKI